MGLDITAYRQLSKIDNPVLDEDGTPTEEMMDEFFWISSSVLESSARFGQGQANGLSEGVYDYEDSTGFRAGSYSGYGEWRRNLARLAGYTGPKEVWANPPPGPFIELINFAENEGVIGPVASAKLVKDFAAFREKASVFLEGEDRTWFFELYCEWQQAFEMAADGGAVNFH